MTDLRPHSFRHLNVPLSLFGEVLLGNNSDSIEQPGAGEVFIKFWAQIFICHFKSDEHSNHLTSIPLVCKSILSYILNLSLCSGDTCNLY